MCFFLFFFLVFVVAFFGLVVRGIDLWVFVHACRVMCSICIYFDFSNACFVSFLFLYLHAYTYLSLSFGVCPLNVCNILLNPLRLTECNAWTVPINMSAHMSMSDCTNVCFVLFSGLIQTNSRLIRFISEKILIYSSIFS